MKRNSLFAAMTLVAALGTVPALGQTTGTTTASPSADWVTQQSGEWRISRLNGLTVYNRDNQKLGSIDDLLVDRQGQIRAAVLGVGGFLGVGDRLVAVPLDHLQFVYRNANGQYVGADGVPVAINNPSTAPNPNAATANPTDGSVSGAVNNAGRAVGHAAVVLGGALSDTVSNAVNGNGNSLTPDRAILDATKNQLMNAPQFQYGNGS